MSLSHRIVLYLLVLLLLIFKLIYFFTSAQFDLWEFSNILVSSSVISFHRFFPSFFHLVNPYGGGGDYIYSIVSGPFIKTFGPCLFSIRILSLILNLIELLLLFYLVYRYFNFSTAVIASLFFIFPTEYISEASVIGMGRHYHFNFFFLLVLLCFLNFQQSNSLKWLLIFSICAGLGIYFYPAFLFTTIIFLVFMLTNFNWLNWKDYLKYFSAVLLILVIGSGYRVLFFQFPLKSLLYFPLELVKYSPKTVYIEGNFLSILKRFFFLIFFLWPDFYSGRFLELVGVPYQEFVGHIHCINGNCFSSIGKYFLIPGQIWEMVFINMVRLFLLLSFVAFLYRCIKALGKMIFNFFHCKGKKRIPLKDYFLTFLILHLGLYGWLYSFNSKGFTNYKYFLPLFTNILLLFTVLSKINKVTKFIGLPLLLLPPLVYNFNYFIKAEVNPGLLKPVYYVDYVGIEYLGSKNSQILQKGLKFHPLLSHSLGMIYGYYPSHNVTEGLKIYNQVCKREREKVEFIKGWFYQLGVSSSLDIEVFKEISQCLRTEEIKYAYIGWGEASVKLIEFNHFLPDKILKFGIKIPDDMKCYFFQGIGEGLMSFFCMNFNELSYFPLVDVPRYNLYLNIIPDNYITDFLQGFLNKDRWLPVGYQIINNLS